MSSKTAENYDDDFTLRNLERIVRERTQGTLPHAIKKAEVIERALKWDREHPDKAAAQYEADLAKYPQKILVRRSIKQPKQTNQGTFRPLPHGAEAELRAALRKWFALWRDEPGLEHDPNPHDAEKALSELEGRLEAINQAEVDRIVAEEEDKDVWE